MQQTDLAAQIPELRLPAYFLHGRYDYTCAYPLARAYVQRLRAPVKGFYTFDQSAHSPVFEEPARARTILREDVLTGDRRLADPL
jgi:pimeloyl-ACP methyl ester carboxylesterase